MYKTLIITFIIFLQISNSHDVWASEKSTKKTMNNALESLIKLSPFIGSEIKFQDPQFEKKIEVELIKLVNTFKDAKHNKEIKLPNLYPSYQLLTNNLEEALFNFQNGNKVFSRLRLNETTNLCLSCHTQIPKDHLTSSLFDKKQNDKNFIDSPFEKARFFYVIRDYKNALASFDDTIIQKLSSKKLSAEKSKNILFSDNLYDKKLYQSFYQSIIIYTKVLKTPTVASQKLTYYINNFKIPNYIITDLNNWKEQLRPWIKIEKELSKPMSITQLKIYIKTIEEKMKRKNEELASGSFDIDLMMISGLLGNYYQENHKKEINGEVLYWLGVSEYRLSKTLFFNLGDHYLQSCINNNPKTAIAKKCYESLENEIKFRYTGSAGTLMPDPVKAKLQKLKLNI